MEKFAVSGVQELKPKLVSRLISLIAGCLIVTSQLKCRNRLRGYLCTLFAYILKEKII